MAIKWLSRLIFVCMSYAVYLVGSPLPFPFSAWIHTWFVTCHQNQYTRWEVWQTPHEKEGRHLIRNLMTPWRGIRRFYWGDVGSYKAEVLMHWSGDGGSLAERLYTEILQSYADYPWLNQYRFWPGPNSNTYTSFILRKAGIDLLGWRAAGAQYAWMSRAAP